MGDRHHPDDTRINGPAKLSGKLPKGEPWKLAARRQREAEALRANLRKRKDQARARENPEQE